MDGGEEATRATEEFYRWIGTSELGCIFASVLVEDELGPSNDRNWEVLTFPDMGNRPQRVPMLANAFLDQAQNEIEALFILLPGENMNRPEGVIQVINALCSHPRWFWEEIPVDGELDPKETGDDYTLIGLRWELETEDVDSWVLGFADIGTMPMTRRAPHLALGLRPKTAPDEYWEDHPDDDLEGAAHFAHMAGQVPYEDMGSSFPLMKAKTENLKEKLVGAERRFAARARVTFSIPATMRDQLCHPREG